MSGYAFHPEAVNDLYDIWEYIAADNIDAADRVREEIFETLRSLARVPHQGHRRPDLTSRALRFTVVREYVIAYAPDEEPLWVIAILHGHRKPSIMAAILRNRQ